MNRSKVNFDEIEWETAVEGARSKVFRQGNKQIRLIELTKDFTEPEWCLKGHIGYIIEGKLEIDFNIEKIQFAAGDGIFIPEVKGNEHKARALTDKTKLILIEEVENFQ